MIASRDTVQLYTHNVGEAGEEDPLAEKYCVTPKWYFDSTKGQIRERGRVCVCGETDIA